MPDLIPPMPDARPEGASLMTRLRLARRDLFSALPPHLYRAWMAEVRAPFRTSVLVNDTALVREVLERRPQDFPKADLIGETLAPLLGRSVFVTNGDEWRRQRRIIDPAFEGGRLRHVLPAMSAAGQAACERLAERAGDTPVEIEFETAHLAADVIFRTLFSLPISDTDAAEVFSSFRSYQRAQPVVNLASLMRLPRWMRRQRGGAEAARIRALLKAMTDRRVDQIARGAAPDDLATKIMTTPDPETGARFTADEMTDQVAIFFLAGHETSASALSWALWLLAAAPEVQDRAAAEALAAWTEEPDFADLSRLGLIRDIFRETLRIYPPVPVLVRETAKAETFRKRDLPTGSLVLISPWHLGRHERIWDRPHVFDPDRWAEAETREAARKAHLPFSSGPRVCTGAGFAMVEGVVLLAHLLRRFRFETLPDRTPKPVHHLTVRAEDGIWLKVSDRQSRL